MHTNSEKICNKITSHRHPSYPLGQFLKKKKKKKKKMENFELVIDGTVGLL